MAKKTNKTSHVLNLITGGGTEAEAESQQSSLPAQDPASVQPKESLQPDQKVVVVDPGQDEQIAEDIRRGILSEMEDTIGASEEAQEQEKADKAAQLGEDALKEELTENNETEHVEEPEKNVEEPEEHVEEPVENVEESVERQESSEEVISEACDEKKTQPEQMYRMANVMEEILNPDMIKREMEKYGGCMCSRCQADVLALVLTRLPSKYIVADKAAISPLLGYYRSKYSSNLLTQLIKACLDVKERPRHDRKEPYVIGNYADK